MSMNFFEYSRILDRFPGKRIAVIGDLMLDVYLWGRVTRISPEAPVPVVNVRRRTGNLPPPESIRPEWNMTPPGGPRRSGG